MRDPNRITPIIKHLEMEWQRHPDWRFGQLLINFGLAPDSVALWAQEDDIVADRLRVPAKKQPLYKDDRGVMVKTHRPDRCKGQFCVIHNPSNHHMRKWPTVIRTDKMYLVERLCDHGVGHPDPDSLAYFIRVGYDSLGVHGCDGCCRKPEERKPLLIDTAYFRRKSEDRPSEPVSPRRACGPDCGCGVADPR